MYFVLKRFENSNCNGLGKVNFIIMKICTPKLLSLFARLNRLFGLYMVYSGVRVYSSVIILNFFGGILGKMWTTWIEIKFVC